MYLGYVIFIDCNLLILSNVMYLYYGYYNFRFKFGIYYVYLSSLFSVILTEVLQVAKDMVSGQQKKKKSDRGSLKYTTL